LIKNLKNTSDRALLGNTYCLVGKWLGQSQSEGAKDIMSNYLVKAIEYSPDKSKAHFTYAKFLDALYNNIIRKQKSQEWLIAQELRKQNQSLLDDYEKYKAKFKKGEVPKEITRTISTLTKTINKDKTEDAQLVKDMTQYLLDAIQNYGEAAKHGDKYDLNVVFRVCSLWFNNAQSKEVNEKFEKLFKQNYIATYKFIPLIYQIASRIGSPTDKFHQVIRDLVLQIASQHPYHSLYQIFALKNGAAISGDDEEADNTFVQVDQDKIKAAEELLNTLSKSKETLKSIIHNMGNMIDAFKQLAFWDVDQYKHLPTFNMSSDLPLQKVRFLKNIPVPTYDLEVRPDAQYLSGFPTVIGFDKTITLCGGLNLPKIIRCLASNGKAYRQLVKGKDDLRQDAVMQQIFSLVNDLLRENKETRQRSLRIRTYKIIPLSPNSGLLGFVENTMPLAEYLLGPSKNIEMGAHLRYRPNDMPPQEARRLMTELAKANAPDEQRRRVYDTISQRLKPVFHHFFLERFPNPADWFAKRLNYTRSVAANSIVGYIIGLGDRHSHNILLDLTTAEHVHIDLGVAFEQGKLLPTPERVPFRLTRDIVDGFGVSGTEGVFRRCAESTLKVLRHNADLLSTIVEVFVHDPLYRWSLPPLKALKVQRNRDDDESDASNSGAKRKQTTLNIGARVEIRNQDAERILLRLNEKLQGYEEGEMLSVKGQVNKLIAQAMDPQLLSRMFHGWAAWL
jgi:ataxia telangiectasia mutated family protein